jgi:hypothetical protein
MPSAVLATAIQDRVTNAKHYFFLLRCRAYKKADLAGNR